MVLNAQCKNTLGWSTNLYDQKRTTPILIAWTLPWCLMGILEDLLGSGTYLGFSRTGCWAVYCACEILRPCSLLRRGVINSTYCKFSQRGIELLDMPWGNCQSQSISERQSCWSNQDQGHRTYNQIHAGLRNYFSLPITVHGSKKDSQTVRSPKSLA